jgi:fumarate reductase (CoM/CoB) subunit A
MSKEMNSDVETDVLVVGSGGAGLRAAVEASKSDLEVTVVTKGLVGKDCCTQKAEGFAVHGLRPDITTDVWVKNTLKDGAYLNNEKLLKILAEEGLLRIKEMENFGAVWDREPDGTHFQGYPLSHGFGMSFKDATGFHVVKTLRDEVQRRDIRVFEQTLVTNLLTSRNGEVSGVIGIDIPTGILTVFKAKSTVLATGGIGQLYDTTTNPLQITGDGIAAAYRAGAEIIDMEQVQFLHICFKYPETLKGEPIYGVGPNTYFLNALGERFLKNYDPERMEDTTRDIACRAFLNEVKEGRGSPHGGVYIDLSNVPNLIEDLRKSKPLVLELRKAGILDYTKDKIEAAPSAHHLMGGIRINEKCESSLKGLYAAGEVAGGVHGGNRLSGNALQDIIVFGARAGKYAAEYASASSLSEIDETQVEKEFGRIEQLLKTRPVGVRPVKVKDRIKTLMSTKVGVIRDGTGLSEALNEIGHIKAETTGHLSLGSTDPAFNYELMEAIEVQNMLDVAEMIVRAALYRTESRGAHYRIDYPQMDDTKWLKNMVVKKDGEEMKVFTRAVVRM